MPILSSIGAMSIGTTASNDISIHLSTTSFLFNTSGIGIMSRFITVSGGVGPYTYSFSPSLPGGVTFNASSGTFTGTPLGATPTTAYDITVADSNFSTKTVTINITTEIFVPKPITVLVTQIPAITVGTTVNSLVASATGGWPGTLTFSATGLPPGLSLTSGGYLIGTLGTPNPFVASANIIITATDKTGATGSSTLTVTITPAPIVAYSLYPDTVNIVDIGVATGVTDSIVMFDSSKQPSGGTPPYNYYLRSGSNYGFNVNNTTGTTTGVADARLLPGYSSTKLGLLASVYHQLELHDSRGLSTPSPATSIVNLHLVNRSGVSETYHRATDAVYSKADKTYITTVYTSTITINIVLYHGKPAKEIIPGTRGYATFELYFGHTIPSSTDTVKNYFKISDLSLSSNANGKLVATVTYNLNRWFKQGNKFNAYIKPVDTTLTYGVEQFDISVANTGNSPVTSIGIMS
jgi:hypothetical protein